MTAGIAANETGGGGDQRLGDSRGDRPQGRCARGAQPVEGIDDAPHRAEQPDKWRHRAGGRQPWQTPLQPRQLFRRRDLRRPLHGHDTQRSRLAAQLFHRPFQHRNQRARLELLGHRRHLLQPPALAEGPQEARTLHFGAPHGAPLGQDHGPGEEAEDQQN